MTNTSILSSVASSATLEDAGPATNRPTLEKQLKMRKLKRGFSVLLKEVACKFYMRQIGGTRLIGA